MFVDAAYRQKVQQYKYTRVIFKMVVVYFVCWYPSMIMILLTPFDFNIGIISQLLVAINAVFDPIIYLWAIKDLRTQFHTVMHCSRSSVLTIITN